MAVYTEVPDHELAAFLDRYDIGNAQTFKGIAEGVENSNYLLGTDRGQFILTLYEKRVKREDLPFFLGLMDHLAQRGFPCPVPVHDRSGHALQTLCGRPAALITFLNGIWPKRIEPFHCLELGRTMAMMHALGADFEGRRENDLIVPVLTPLLERCAAAADAIEPGLETAIRAEHAALVDLWPTNLPEGVIHADLFPDNVFFLGKGLSGVIDFYFACNGFLAYDLAVAINAWCFEQAREFNVTKAAALLQAYTAARPLTEAERHALPVLCRGAALRFFLTRLYDWSNTPDSAFVQRKDPAEYLHRLRFHQQAAGPGDYGLSPSG